MPINNAFVEPVFIATIRVVGGEKELYLDAAEAGEYERDPDNFAASTVGLSLPDYVEWIRTEGTPLCSEYTKQGKLCRSIFGANATRAAPLEIAAPKSAVRGTRRSSWVRLNEFLRN